MSRHRIRRTPSLFEKRCETQQRRILNDLDSLDELIDRAQAELSRSYHELNSVGQSPERIGSFRRDQHTPLRRRKSAVELSETLPKAKSDDDEIDERPVLRRKRFTRRQRKSLVIEPATGLILASGPQDSSSDEEQTTRSRSLSREKSLSSSKSRQLSTSANALSTLEQSQSFKEKSRKYQAKGPAARKAKRALKNQQMNAASTNKLDLLLMENSLKPQQRSMSVRTLNGEEYDFSNQDSVTKWASQMLAEIDSLPSSCVDLTAIARDSERRTPSLLDEKRKYATIDNRGPPAPPPHRSVHPVNSLDNKRLTTSLTSSVSHLPSDRFRDTSFIRGSTIERPTSLKFVPADRMANEDVMKSSYYSTCSDRSSTIREDSVLTSTLVGSPTDSEAGTPRALTPLNEIPSPSMDTSPTAGYRSIGVQGGSSLSPPPLLPTRSEESLSLFLPNTPQDCSMHISLSPKSQDLHCVGVVRGRTTSSQTVAPIPAKRTIRKSPYLSPDASEISPRRQLPRLSGSPSSRSSTEVRFRQNGEVRGGAASSGQQSKDALTDVDKRLQSSIARLTQSVYGDLRREFSDQDSIPSRRSIPTISIATDDDEDDDLKRWRERAQCRAARSEGERQKTSTSPMANNRSSIVSTTAATLPRTPVSQSSEADVGGGARSVNRVVASLIRSIEDGRWSAPDRPTSLLSPAQDVGTQTSPFSISRSSSFDWLNEPSENALRDLKTPISTPRSERAPPQLLLRVLKGEQSSSETDEADREVAEMTGVADRMEMMSSTYRTSSGTTASVSQRLSSDGGKSSRARSSHYSTETPHDKLLAEMDESIAMLLEYGQRNRQYAPKPMPRSSVAHPPTMEQRHSASDSYKDSDSLPSELRDIQRKKPVAPMTDSIYDNMPSRRRRQRVAASESPLAKPRTIMRDYNTVLSNESLAAHSKSSTSERKSLKSMSSLTTSNGTMPSEEVAAPAMMSTTAMKLAPPLSKLDRAGSCELLNEDTSSSDENYKAKLRKAEEEACECCDWLRNAGFPQYATQYEEGEFPVDIHAVQLDHPFLDQHCLAALNRRLKTLNRCAIMKIDQVVLRRRNDDYMYGGMDDEDHVALSSNWQYQRHSHTWSRIGNEQMFGAPGRIVSTKPNLDERIAKDRQVDRRERYEQQRDSTCEAPSEASAVTSASGNGKLQRSQSERIKETARAIIKKMDLRSSSRRRKETHRDPSQMVIGDPVLVSYDSASPESMRMFPRGLRPAHIGGVERGRAPPAMPNGSAPAGYRQPRSKSARRQGFVMLSPSSPESSSTDDSFLSPPHRRDRSIPPSRRDTTRRDHSVPPRVLQRTPAEIRLVDYYLPHQYIPPSDRPRRERLPYDSYLYPGSQSWMNNRSSQQPRRGSPFYDARTEFMSSPPLSGTFTGSSQFSAVPYPNCVPAASGYNTASSEHSSLPSTTARSRPVITDDGYYMHDSSINRFKHTEKPSTSHGVPQLRVDCLNTNKSESSLDNTDEEQSSNVTVNGHHRRDSGVGSSLSRSPSGPSAQRLRQSILPYATLPPPALTASLFSNSSWTVKRRPNERPLMSNSVLSSSTTAEDVFFTDIQLSRCIDSLGVMELSILRKLAFLRITALLEKYLGPNASIKMGGGGGNGGSNNPSPLSKQWAVHKLIKKIKHGDGKPGKDVEDNTVFGQPLELIYRRTGLCLPRSVLEVLRFLRQMSSDQVGIFRKNGVKSRIAELRAICDRDSEFDVFVGEHQLESGQVHDAGDMLKQYLRELPEPLMTVSLSETFANIFMNVPVNERLISLQYAVLLLPDENREALQTLLLFLNDVAKYSDVNNMNAQNLAVCFTPSLFHLSASRLDKVTPTRRHKTIGAAGMPTEQEMRETRACQECLTMMIQEVRQIFVAPEVSHDERIDSKDDFPLLKELGGAAGPRSFLVRKIKEMIKDHSDRWKGWIVEGSYDGVEISSKKPQDTHPLKPFRVWVDVDAPPKEVMHRIMKERCIWDTSVVNWRTCDVIHSPDTDIHQYVINDTVGHPTRDCYLARVFRVELQEIRGACAIAERSVQCSETQLLGGVSAAVLDSRFLIEPSAGRSRVTYISRVDFRGRLPTWYTKVYGKIVARQLARLRDSYQMSSASDNGPETKV